MDLKVADESLGLAPICVIKEHLDRIFGKGVWKDYEVETMSIELGIVMDPLLRDKINVLIAMEFSPDKFYEEPLFFLFATEVMNNKIADFTHLPMPTSLEMAYAIKEMSLTFPGTFEYPVKKAVTFILNNEGYSKALGPFKDVAYEDELHQGQLETDTADKLKAINQYIKGMNNDN